MNNEKLEKSVQEEIDLINLSIKLLPNGDSNKVSDGYHTFGELYEHRIALFMKLAEWAVAMVGHKEVWISKKHSDGSEFPGWFLLGIGILPGKQITYHLPESKWDQCDFAMILERAPGFDGHTSADVLERLKQL